MQAEVNGMILEFDEKALLKQEIKVGDSVQLLIKEYQTPKLYAGVVTQILPFEPSNPCIEVMYISHSYSDFEIKKVLITNSPDEDKKIIKQDIDFMSFTKDRAIDMIDANIRKCEAALREALEKKEYFLRYYGKYFSQIEKEGKAEEKNGKTD